MKTELGMIEALRNMYYNYSPSELCYIKKIDGEGYAIEEVDGDCCHWWVGLAYSGGVIAADGVRRDGKRYREV